LQIEGKINNDLAIIALDGHLTHNTANEFRDVWDPITKMDEVSKVILDFEKVNFISSQGVG